MTRAPLYDAHCHLQDTRLQPFLPEILSSLPENEIRQLVVNGTQESDWDDVEALATAYPHLITPSFGIHPWYAASRTTNWKENLTKRLHNNPHAGIGEIGLDRWIQGHDLLDQEPVFRFQLELGAERDLPTSIHCLRCWGRMLEILETSKLPTRGFLLHSYGGPRELVPPLVQLGAYFSFPGYFLEPRKIEKALQVFSNIPPDRILIETDAPDQALPLDLEKFHLPLPSPETRLNHPANLTVIAEVVSSNLSISPTQLASNFLRFYAEGLSAT